MARILIVDDEYYIRSLLKRLLRREEHECEVAATADEAWEKLAAQRFDLALADVNMPGTSGLDLAPRISERYPDTPVVMVTGVDDPQVARQAMDNGAYGYIIKPFEPNEILIGVTNALRRRELELYKRREQERLEAAVDERTRELRETVERLQEARAELERVEDATLTRLARTWQYRDPRTSCDVERISRLSGLLAARGGLTRERVERIQRGSIVHDIGKIAVPEEILQKPGPCTDEELSSIRQHAEIGRSLLAGSGYPVLDVAATIAHAHHERWDGRGYPRGLAGDAIPIEGRIVALADVFDAITSPRPHREAFTEEDAVALLRDERGKQFDPQLVDLFLSHLDEVREIARESPGSGDADETAKRGDSNDDA